MSSHYKTVPSLSLPLRATGWKEQREKGKQNLLLQPKVVVLNSWRSFEDPHESPHCNSHSKEAGEPEVTATVSGKWASLDGAYTLSCTSASLYIGNMPISKKVTITYIQIIVHKTTQLALLLLTVGVFLYSHWHVLAIESAGCTLEKYKHYLKSY